jgi:crotonobetainyl-CoA:carnitine CoA-transferase CaiB-like acyl-CoA transferase
MSQDVWQCLSGIKALDLTGEMGHLCGKILADMGIDVIKVEPPGGDPSRNIGPFYKDIPHHERSLSWFAYNTNKRGITLNLEKEQGRNILKKLTGKIDILIESFPPGKMKKLGLDYDDLSDINPGLIYTSITPFGRTGPGKDYKVTDLVAMATGGPLFLTGEPDRPPVQVGCPQAYLHGGAEAAVATLMALYYREIKGEGQLVDVSIQQSLLITTFQTTPTWYLNHEILPRMGMERAVGPGLRMPLIWPCKDGYMNFTVLGGVPGRKTMDPLATWMEEEGMGDEFISQTDWGAFDFFGLTTELVARTAEPITRFFMRHTKAEIFDEFMKKGAMAFPITTSEDIARDPHLSEKGFWQQVEHPEFEGKIPYPSPPSRINEEYPPVRRRPPLTGEHNEEVYRGILGISREELSLLKEEGVV